MSEKENFEEQKPSKYNSLGYDAENQVFEDGFVNPPEPLTQDGRVDLNEVARQSRDGERRSITTISELLNGPNGYHNTHIQNPELHPPREGEIITNMDSIRAIAMAMRKTHSDTSAPADAEE